MIIAKTKDGIVSVRMGEHTEDDSISKETYLDEVCWILYQGIQSETATDIELRYMLNVASKLARKGGE